MVFRWWLWLQCMYLILWKVSAYVIISCFLKCVVGREGPSCSWNLRLGSNHLQSCKHGELVRNVDVWYYWYYFFFLLNWCFIFTIKSTEREHQDVSVGLLGGTPDASAFLPWSGKARRQVGGPQHKGRHVLIHCSFCTVPLLSFHFLIHCSLRVREPFMSARGFL